MEARWARTARGWSAALLAGALTATLHASAGGAFPAPAVVLLAVLLAGLVSTVLVGRTPSLPRLTAAVAIGQLTFHTVFTALGDTGAVALVPSPAAGHAGHALAAELAGHPATNHSGPGMLIAHLVAGIGSALLLTHSERALAGMRRLAALTLRRLTGAPTPLPRPHVGRPVLHRTVARPSAAVVIGTLRYRGPPARLRAA
jgi:hypothetical protein